jgi:hypothetical protein
VNTTDSGPITTIPEEDNVQGKFILYITNVLILQQKMASIDSMQILTRSLLIKYDFYGVVIMNCVCCFNLGQCLMYHDHLLYPFLTTVHFHPHSSLYTVN